MKHSLEHRLLFQFILSKFVSELILLCEMNSALLTLIELFLRHTVSFTIKLKIIDESYCINSRDSLF